MPEYRIYYEYNGYGSTHIKAEDEESAREKFYDGEYEENNEETSDYEISEIIDEAEERAESTRQLERFSSSTSPDEIEYLCACGNPVEKKGDTCDQCWAGKIKT